MSKFAPAINADFAPTGRRFAVVEAVSVAPGTQGEALKFFGWGGVVLLLDGETSPRTFAQGDVVEIARTI